MKGTGFDTEYGDEAEQEKKILKEAEADAADTEVDEADVNPTLERYNELLWMCASARELR